jgi:hypothetical protein
MTLTRQAGATPAQLRRSWLDRIEVAENMLAAGDPELARRCACEAERLALMLGEPRPLRRTGRIFESLAEPGRAAGLVADAERIEQPCGPAEWTGEPLDGRLAVISRIDHVGRPIRMARLIHLASLRVARCTVIAEPRLVPLFRRSFPLCETVASGDGDAAILAASDAVAGYNTLARHLCGDAQAMKANFRPLLPDKGMLGRLRKRYGSDALVGISWHSVGENKDLPGLERWSEFLGATDADFLSLQYGDIAADADYLKRSGGRKLIHDGTIDPLLDLDGFAAQIAACRAVVTISNTCAHMAGAMGKRTFLLLDDDIRLSWPADGLASPWYPATTIIRRRARPWAKVFEEARMRLSRFLTRRAQRAPSGA